MDISASALTITLPYNGKNYTLELLSFSGGGEFGESELFQVFIDRYYQGRIYKKGDTWHALDEFKPSAHHPFTINEKWLHWMGERIERHFKSLNNKKAP